MSASATAAQTLQRAPRALQEPQHGADKTQLGLAGGPAASLDLNRHVASRCADLPKAFTAAVKTAVMPWFTPGCEPTGELVAYALLVVALHTGRNTTPLLELPIDCIRAHPKDNTAFLVVYKRRGHTTSKVILRGESKINRIVESTPTLRPTVLELLRRVIAGTEKLREEASPELRDRVWIYRSQSPTGGVTDLGAYALASAITKLVDDYKLLDADGKPLKLNVSRLRKTFVNRLYELLDGNVAAVATAAGNSTQVTGRHYLRPTVASERNWAFMGKVLVQELLAGTVGATARTPWPPTIILSAQRQLS